MKIVNFNFDWLLCPNCGCDNETKIKQRRTNGMREFYCNNCGYYMTEGFATIMIVGKQKYLALKKTEVSQA